MGKGRRFDEPKLNLKKVFGTIIAFAVVVMIIITLNQILNQKAKEAKLNEKTTYFSAYNNGSWGVINNRGEIVINTAYKEMLAIPNPEKAVFVYAYDVDDKTGTYKSKAIDETGKPLFTQYDKVEAIENFDSRQNVWFEEDVLRVLKDGKYGLIDCDGNELFGTEYDEIVSLKSVPGNLIVKKDNKVGLVNLKGQEIIPVAYNDIKVLKEGYKNEYIIVDENGNSGVISTSGDVIIEPKYQDIKYLNSTDMYAARIEEKWTLVSKKGDVINNSYDDYTYIKGDYVIVKKDDKYGIITTAGDVKIEPQYEDLQYAFSVYYIAKISGKYGIINTDNTVVIPQDYLTMTYWSDKDIIIADKTETETVIFDSSLTQKLSGIFVYEEDYIKARINGEDKYYTYKFEEKKNTEILTQRTLFVSIKNGKYGFVDSQGNVVVDYKYDEAKEQNKYGYSAIKLNGLWGAIDKGGKVVLEPTVNLDDSIYIDFIGAWHLADEGIYYIK